MEFAQSALTIVIEVVAIAGFGGIVLHAIWSQHQNWMAQYCPPVGQSQKVPEAQSEITQQVSEAQPEVEREIQLEAEAIATVPLLQLQPVGAAVIDLSAMNVRELRDFAKERRIKGYSAILKNEGKEGLRRYIESQL